MTTTPGAGVPRRPAVAPAAALALLPLCCAARLIPWRRWEWWPSSRRQRSPPSLDPLTAAHRPRRPGITVASPLLGGRSACPGAGGGVLSSRIVWANLVGVPGPPAHPAVSGGAALDPRICSGGAVVAAAGVETGRGGAGHRHPLCRPWWPRVVSDLLDALAHRPLQALRSGGRPAGAALLTALDRPCCPGPQLRGYRLECALRSATLLGVFGSWLGTELRLSLHRCNFTSSGPALCCCWR